MLSNFPLNMLCSFSRSQRQGEGDSNPGPGAYDADQNRVSYLLEVAISFD